MKVQKVIGVDVGGTKIHTCLVEKGKLIKDVKLATPAQAPQQTILSELISGIEQLLEPGVEGIGIGVPGLVDEKSGVVYGPKNIPSWQEVPLKTLLENHFNLPVYVCNDANSFVLGEKMFGKGQPYNNLVGVTLGTGFGTGIVINNSLYPGTLSSAGEFGGISYLDATLEDYCSGKFFLRHCGVSGSVLQQQALKGDVEALKVFYEFGQHVGNSLKVILYALSPEAIFLGGSVSQCYGLFQEGMEESLSSFPFQKVIDRLVVEPSRVSNVAVLGAAALVLMQSEKLKEKVPFL